MVQELDRVLRDFLAESKDNLERLDHQFVVLEQEPENHDVLAEIFRTIHTIKGSAGFLNLARLEQLSHQTEDVLAKLRDRSLMLDTDLTTTLLQALDGIKALLLNLENTGNEGDAEVTQIVRTLQQVTQETPNQERGEPVSDVPETPQEGDRLREEHGSPVASRQGPLKASDLNEQERELHEEIPAIRKSEPGEQTPSGREESRIHVDVHVLDQLMDLTGELVLARNQLVQFAGESEGQHVRAVSQRLNAVVSELQETVMKTRMQPIKKVLGVLPRVVRDLSKMHGKAVQLVMEGQETELDRTLIEAMKDPLRHLVRNALDHGIESPEVRRNHGKPVTATIAIKAYHEGGLVHLDVSDDGAGIDVQRITAKAIQDGIVTPQQAEAMSDRQLLALMFRPGFSTAEQVTHISGRGVGMDVVKKNLDRIGGSVEVHTELHKGTTIKIRIPMTLAIIPVLVVTSGDQRFALPQVNLEELIMVQRNDNGGKGIETVSGAEVYRLRGELLPLLRLHDILALSPQVGTQQDTSLHIVVVSAGEGQFGVVVDHIGDTEEIVVKPVSSHIKHLPYYDGATIMGDGSIALILNAGGIFRAAHVSLDEVKTVDQVSIEEEPTHAPTPGEQKQTIVVFRVGAEYYGVPLAFVVRLEEFSASRIESSGGREVLQYRDKILPLMRLEPSLNLPPTPDPETLSLIVFSVEKQIGLVMTEILNTVEISTRIDTETFQQKGILGSTIVGGHSVLILDIHGLIELAYPTWYQQFFVSTLSEADRQQLRILLVEDSNFFRNIEKSYVEAAGYQVITAEHGREALEKLETHPIDMVITDLDMPYCNGFELTRIIKSTDAWQHLPVMALTALSGEEDREKGLAAGIDDYQVKLDRDEVLRALERLIIRRRT